MLPDARNVRPEIEVEPIRMKMVPASQIDQESGGFRLSARGGHFIWKSKLRFHRWDGNGILARAAVQIQSRLSCSLPNGHNHQFEYVRPARPGQTGSPGCRKWTNTSRHPCATMRLARCARDGVAEQPKRAPE